MSEGDFWNLTPAQLHALSRQFNDSRMRQDYGFGMLASIVANVNRDSKKKPRPFEWTDFMPQWAKKARKTSKKSPQELRNYFESFVVPALNARAERQEAEASRG